MKGQEQFSHIIVAFFMHRPTFDPATDLVRHLHDRSDMPNLGIFCQRAKHRPNPIGITAVEPVGIERNVARVKGLDAIDETQVPDIKLYFPAFDRVDRPRVPEWVEKLMAGYF